MSLVSREHTRLACALRPLRPCSPQQVADASRTVTMELEPDSDDDATSADMSHTNCILKDYVLLETLGTGGFSCIRKVSRFNKTTGEEEYFALKIIRRSLKVSNRFGNENEDVVKKEIALLKKLNHPNVVKLLEVIDDHVHNTSFLVLELIPNGQLMDRVSEEEYKSNRYGKFIPEIKLRIYAAEILKGLYHLHENGIVHRDIKPENIMISARGVCKLIDFGVSDLLHDHNDLGTDSGKKETSNLLRNSVGTYTFFSPEEVSLQETGIGFDGFKADIWAVGITLITCLTGKLPYYSKSIFSLFDKIKAHQSGSQILLEIWKERQQGTLDKAAPSREALQFIENMLMTDPNERMSILKALSHPFITGGGGTSEKNQSNADIQHGVVKLSPEDIATAIDAFKVKNIGTFINLKIQLKKMKFNMRKKMMFLREFYKCVRVGDIQNMREMLHSSLVDKDKLLNDCFIRDPEGRCPLHLSVMLNTTEATQLLLDEGAFPSCSTCDGTMPLHLAAENNKLDQIRVLLCAGANPYEVRSSDNKTAVDLATNSEAREIMIAHENLHGVGKAQVHKKGSRHSVKNPFFASRTMSQRIIRKTEGKLEAWVEVRFQQKKSVFAMFKKIRWEKKFLSAKNDGMLSVYKASEDANEKMVVEEKLVLYDNRAANNIRRNDSFRRIMATNGCKDFRLVSYCSLEGFDKDHPHTLQLVINRQKIDSKKATKSTSSRSFFASKLRPTSMLLNSDTNHVLISVSDIHTMKALEGILQTDIRRTENANDSDDDDDEAVAVDDIDLKSS